MSPTSSRLRAKSAWIAVALAAAALGAAAAAGACPACIDSSANAGVRRTIPVILGFMAIPFGVVGLVTFEIRRRLKTEERDLDRRIPTAVGPDRLVYGGDADRGPDAGSQRPDSTR